MFCALVESKDEAFMWECHHSEIIFLSNMEHIAPVDPKGDYETNEFVRKTR